MLNFQMFCHILVTLIFLLIILLICLNCLCTKQQYFISFEYYIPNGNYNWINWSKMRCWFRINSSTFYDPNRQPGNFGDRDTYAWYVFSGTGVRRRPSWWWFVSKCKSYSKQTLGQFRDLFVLTVTNLQGIAGRISAIESSGDHIIDVKYTLAI